MKKLVLFLILLQCIACTNSKDPYPYTFRSIKNFHGTDVETLARYVKNEDTLSIIRFLNDNPSVSIDTKDRYFGSTLLMWAIYNGKYKAFHCLLNHGADPNSESDYRHETPLYFVCAYIDSDYKGDARYCKALLEHGADPNKNNPLEEAAVNDLECTKLLIEYGADYNQKKGRDSYANMAILQGKDNIAEYLIIEKKAVLYSAPYFDFWNLKDPHSALIKKKIEDYLKSHPEQLKY